MFNVGKIMQFGAEHPGIFKLLDKFPKLDKETWSMVVEFLERALREPDPERFIQESLRAAQNAPRGVKNARVTVVGKKDNP